MTQKKHTPTYTAEFRVRGVRLFKENRADYQSDNAAYKAIASKLGCSHDTLRSQASVRTKSDACDSAEIERVHEQSGKRYGARKVWHQLGREGTDIARCTVERLMNTMAIQGVVRGKKVITTNPDASQPCPDDKVNRKFTPTSPNQLWVCDFTSRQSLESDLHVFC